MYSHIEHQEEIDIYKLNYPPLDLKEGDWIWSEHFEQANQIKKIYLNQLEPHLSSVSFVYKYCNGLDAGMLEFIENKTGDGYRYHRYATPEEVQSFMLSDIKHIIK